MSLSLDDFEDVKQEEKQSAAAQAAAETASAPASAPATGTGIKPPTSGSSASGLNVPSLINQAWETVKPALNPVHYGAGGPQDYTNIDVPTSVVHGVGLGAAGLGIAGRIKRGLSGEAAANAAYEEQTKLSRERFEYQKQRDALADEQNLRQAESKIVAQAAGKPAPEARIEPTMAPEPVAPAQPPAQPAVTKAAAVPPIPQPTAQQPVDYSLTPANAYGQQKLNAPTGAPNPLPAAQPPAEVAPAPVQPKPVSELEQLRIEKARFDLEAAKAKEARAAEAHASRLAADAKRAEAKAQTKTASGALTPETQKMLESSERAKADKAIAASQKAAAAKAVPPAASVVPPTSQVVQPIAVAPSTTEGLTKEQKGMKNYLVSQYGGGPEGEAAYKKVIEILGEVPAYEKGQGGGLSKEANEAIKSWRQANIEGPKVNLTHDMKKAMKGAGGIAILAAIPGFAEAAQRKDYGAMTDIASDFFVLPFAQSREAGMPKAQEESIISSKFKEASKLGSPYRSVPPPR